MFSGTKQVATDRRASLGSKIFEELTVMKSAWGVQISDNAAWNAAQEEEVDNGDLPELLEADMEMARWDQCGD